MRYKENVLNKISQADVYINRAVIQINRNENKENVLDTLTMLKHQLESIDEIIRIEDDEFEQQFKPMLLW